MNKLEEFKNKMCADAEYMIKLHKKERWSRILGNHDTNEVDVTIYELEIHLQEIKTGLLDTELKGLSEL